MAETIAGLPVRPPSEVEWEELLLRVELMTRAFRNQMEDLDLQVAEQTLREMVERELSVASWLERRALGEPAARPAARDAAVTAASDPADRLADRFVSLRARNFAMVQRRGLGVWDWSGTLGGGGEVSAYQLLLWLVSQDVRSLAALRALGRGEAPAC